MPPRMSFPKAPHVAAALTLVFCACEPAGQVAVESGAAGTLDATSTPPPDAATRLPYPELAPVPDAAPAPTPADADAPGPDAAGTADAASMTTPDALGGPAHDAAAPTTDARGPDPDAGPLARDALPPPADAFVHVLPEAGRPDAALTIADRLAACDADAVLAGRLAVDESGWGHVPVGTEVAYVHNPPASGPHYGQWARSAVYPEALDRRTWVHNLEHGWLVLLYRPDAPAAAVQVLLDAYAAGFADAECPAGPVRRIIVTPDPLLPTPVAAVTAYRALTADRLESAELERMFTLCRVAAPEVRVCGDGQVPAPPSAPPSAP